ncbi:hypothetical protein AMK59_6489 [Oryctes borbonicus]|uniref:Uncharacterized protein n=1 Tax=Oryctes borbonicus TaxID=1629725 RepID=A0A0T6AYZ1_9SCAR|nr:hypothetical protein AMK59_6489 [Oryctes borbonicus]
MFKRNKTPQRKEFSFTTNQIFEDIESIKNDVNQRNKLYLCLDDKIPVVEKQFVNIQEFLKGSDDLENTAETLQHLVEQLESLKKDVLKQKETIKDLVLDV